MKRLFFSSGQSWDLALLLLLLLLYEFKYFVMQGFVTQQQLSKWADGTSVLCDLTCSKEWGVYKGLCLRDAMVFLRFCLVN